MTGFLFLFQNFQHVSLAIFLFPAFITGGYGFDGYYSGDILEYDPEEDSMVTVGQMTRAWHAITVVNTEQYQQWCT